MNDQQRDEEIDRLRNLAMNTIARLGAVETTTRILFALICSFDGRPEMLDKLKNGIFPLMLETTKGKRYEGTPPQLAAWLVDREAQILQDEFAAILEQIEQLRARGRRTVN